MCAPKGWKHVLEYASISVNVTDVAFTKIPLKHGFKDITQHMSGKTELSNKSGKVGRDIMTGDSHFELWLYATLMYIYCLAT